MWQDMLIDLGVSALFTAIRNPQKAEVMRRTFLKLFKLTWARFGDDPEFQAVVQSE